MTRGNLVLTIVGVIVVGVTTVWFTLSGIDNAARTSVNKTPAPVATQAKSAFFPEPTGYVMDTSHKLSANAVATLTKDLTDFDKIAQIAVVTVDTTAPLYLEEYSIKLAEKLKVGYKGIDNGVILLVAVKDRKIRIEVGRGAEAQVTDAEAGRIINNIIGPKLKAGDWDGGIIAGVAAIKAEFK